MHLSSSTESSLLPPASAGAAASALQREALRKVRWWDGGCGAERRWDIKSRGSYMRKNLLQSLLLALQAMRRATCTLHGPSFTCRQRSAESGSRERWGGVAWSNSA